MEKDLYKLVDEKLEEDIIMSIIAEHNIIELHKPNEEGFYSMRVTNLSEDEFKETCAKRNFYKLSEWMKIDKESFKGLIRESKNYLMDLFFDIQ